jgi:ribosome recycling factor
MALILRNKEPGQMIFESIVKDSQERMDKAVAVLAVNLSGIRTGRANTGLVESVRVEAYGSQAPLKQLASISTPEPQQIMVRPYDPTIIKDIEKAIAAGELGLNPQNDGRIIRINVPQLSTEVRRKMVACVKDLAEETKVSIRNIRRDANKSADSAEKGKALSEDERTRLKEEIQELTKKYEQKVVDLAKARESEILEN